MKFSFPAASLRDRIHSVSTFLSGAAVALVGLGLPAILVLDYSMNAGLGAVATERLDNFVQTERQRSHPGQAAIHGPGSLESGTAAALGNIDGDFLAGSWSIAELAAIAPGSGSPLPEDLGAPESPLSDKASWLVQLAALNSRSDAATEWRRLQRANPDLLDNLTLNLQPTELPNGTFYRVQTGPFADKVAATDLCNSLKKRNQDCLVVVR